MGPRILLSCLWAFGASAGMGQTLTCTIQFIGSGTLGPQAFSNANITITTVGNIPSITVTAVGDTPITPNTARYSLVNTSAYISVSGLGTAQFTVATNISMQDYPGASTFGFGAGAPYPSLTGANVVTLGGPFYPWAMSTSVGPVASAGNVDSWNSSPITTTSGVVNVYDAYGIPISFQASLSGPTSPPALIRTGVLPHIAAGDGWATVITLINISLGAVPVTVEFHGDDGSALSLPVTATNQGASQTITTASVNATINPNATFLITTGQIPSTVVGWADVLSTGSLGGFVIFRQTPQTGSPSEGTAPLQSEFPSAITLPYDNTNGFVMGVALANLSTAQALVTATMWDANGNQIGIQTLTIGGSGHTSFVLPDQFPATVGQLGIVQFQSNASGGLAGLGLRFSPFGTFTSVPTM